MKQKFLISATALLVILATVIIIFVTNHNHKSVERQYPLADALEALTMWGYARAYPNGAIPDVSHYAAFEKNQQMKLKTLKKESLGNTWETMGPWNMGGRMLFLAFNPQNPNTIYAGSASGGLWRSKTAGVGAQAWEYVTTGHPVLGVGTIAIAKNDSNTMYIGTGEVYFYQFATINEGGAYRAGRGSYGIGILKTVDGGKTWSKSLDWSFNQSRGVWAIAINQQNPNSVYAATTEGTYKSTNAGGTWTRIHEVVMANDIVINPEDTSIVIVACGNMGSDGNGIYRTTDAGKTWTKCTAGLPETFNGKAHLKIYEPFPYIVYASIGNGFNVGDPNNATWLCQSIDKGETWIAVSEEDYSKWQGWFSHDIAVDPTDYSNVMAVGIDVWKSRTGGTQLALKTNWGAGWGGPIPPGEPEGPSNFSHADHHDVVYHPTDPNIVYVANDGGVFRSTDGGETFSGCNGGLQTVQFYSGFSCSQQDSNFAMGGMQDNGTILYIGSTTWFRYVLGGDGGWTAINAQNDNIVYGESQGLALSRSNNRGRSWQGISPPRSAGPTCFIAPHILGIDNPNVMYAGRDVIFKSINGGTSWSPTNNGTALDSNPVFNLAISHQNSDVVYAATAPYFVNTGVFRTTDGGNSWVNIRAGLPYRFPGDLEVDPTNDNIVYYAASGYGSSHVYRSTDRGDHWQDIGAGLPDVPASAIAIDPLFSNHIYVGNDIGVFVSADTGNTWQQLSDGLPDAVIVQDLVICNVNRKLRLASHGNGAYQIKLLDKIPVSVSENESAPVDFTLGQNYPNPFNPSTTIAYSLTKNLPVTLKIYNALGQEVKTLVRGISQPAGDYQLVWDGKDEHGKIVAGGTYVYRLQAGNQIISKKMSFIK